MIPKAFPNANVARDNGDIVIFPVRIAELFSTGEQKIMIVSIEAHEGLDQVIGCSLHARAFRNQKSAINPNLQV